MKPEDVFIILASQSPRRIDLLEQAGYQFQVIPSMAEEEDGEHHNLEKIVVENAKQKAMAVVGMVDNLDQDHPDHTLVLAADTLVRLGEKVYGKPRNMEEAALFIKELGGVEHEVLSGVFLFALRDRKSLHFLERTKVTLKIMNDEEIAALFAKCTPLDKAAAYGYQDAPEIVEQMEGSANNVIGLPIERLHQALTQLFSD